MKASIGLGRSTAIAAIVAVAVSTLSSYAGISSTVLSVRAENTSGSSTFSVGFSEGNWNAGTGEFTYTLGGPIDLLDDLNSSVTVAALQSASLTIQTGLSPNITLNLGVLGGATDTDFHVDTAQVDFPTIPAAMAEARFQANAQVWDNQNDMAFVWGIDGDPGVGAFRALYNGADPAGTVFSHLVALVMASGGGNASGSESYPQSGTVAVGSSMSDMSVHAAFMVSAGDRAIGGGSYGVTPEPSVAVLLAVGAAVAMHPRRR